jgi:hypothetical protein
VPAYYLEAVKIFVELAKRQELEENQNLSVSKYLVKIIMQLSTPLGRQKEVFCTIFDFIKTSNAPLSYDEVCKIATHVEDPGEFYLFATAAIDKWQLSDKLRIASIADRETVEGFLKRLFCEAERRADAEHIALTQYIFAHIDNHLAGLAKQNANRDLCRATEEEARLKALATLYHG